MSEWKPSLLGRFFLGIRPWRLRLDADRLYLRRDGRNFTVTIGQKQLLTFKAGRFWTDIAAPVRGGGTLVLSGLWTYRVQELQRQLADVISHNVAKAQEAARLEQRQRSFDQSVAAIQLWLAAIIRDEKAHDQERRWFTSETLVRHEEQRPKIPSPAELYALSREPDIVSFLGDRAAKVNQALELWSCDWWERIAKRNERFTKSELDTMADLFNQVEKRPLNEEQRRAVICFNHRVQVVAAAGSGKTSTMVAKAAYAIQRGLVAPDKILMLAFNTDAAEQLQTRAREALKRAGLPDIIITAKTFHKFGLEMLGKAAGRKRGVPNWIIDDEGVPHLAQLIDDLNDHDPAFRTAWDLFRIVFGKDVPRFDARDESGEWDETTQKKRISNPLR